MVALARESDDGGAGAEVEVGSANNNGHVSEEKNYLMAANEAKGYQNNFNSIRFSWTLSFISAWKIVLGNSFVHSIVERLERVRFLQ